MKLNDKAKVFYKDDNAGMLAKTTDLCFAAHQDDIEIMAYGAISKCYGQKDKWFTGVCMTDGAGSPRSGIYADYSDEDMKDIRILEQRNASIIGDYAAQVMLGYPSSAVKSKDRASIKEDVKEIVRATKPETIYIHNLADKHKTHVATAVAVLDALREMKDEYRPTKVYSLEVWRGLDWVNDSEKVLLDTSKFPNVEAALLGVYDSQISGGKRYDSATIGRRLANATFYESHDVDSASSVNYAIDVTALIDGDMSYKDYIGGYIDRFRASVDTMLDELM